MYEREKRERRERERERERDTHRHIYIYTYEVATPKHFMVTAASIKSVNRGKHASATE